MNWPFLLLFVAGFAVTSLAESEKPFPLVGIWRAVPHARDGPPDPDDGELEMDFRADGTLFITIQLYRAKEDLVRLRCRYHYKPPNVVTYTPHGRIVMEKRFTVAAGKLYFEDLIFPTKSEFRHIAKSEFTQKPRDIQGLSELPNYYNATSSNRSHAKTGAVTERQ